VFVHKINSKIVKSRIVMLTKRKKTKIVKSRMMILTKRKKTDVSNTDMTMD
jgi:hypothetical protein